MDLLLSVTFITLSVSSPSLGIQNTLFQLGLLKQFLNITTGLILTIILYYPLSCGLLYLYSILAREHHPYQKPEKLDKKGLSIAVLFILIFNPLTISFLYSSAIYVNSNVINKPCGLEITRFSEPSPARQSGIRPGEIILEINNNPIRTKDDLLEAINDKSPGQYVTLKTDIEDYKVKIIKDSQTGKNVLGVIVKEISCKRGLGG